MVQGGLIAGVVDELQCASQDFQGMCAKSIMLWDVAVKWRKKRHGLTARGRRLVPGCWWLLVCSPCTVVLAQYAEAFENSKFQIGLAKFFVKVGRTNFGKCFANLFSNYQAFRHTAYEPLLVFLCGALQMLMTRLVPGLQ